MDETKRADAPGSPIGSPVERIEDLRSLRGQGVYVDDLTRTGVLQYQGTSKSCVDR